MLQRLQVAPTWVFVRIELCCGERDLFGDGFGDEPGDTQALLKKFQVLGDKESSLS